MDHICFVDKPHYSALKLFPLDSVLIIENICALAQQQQQPNQQALTATHANIAKAVTLPVIFGDERDAIIAKWNQLQAFWGTGKGYFTQQGLFVDFNPSNLFCRFKVIIIAGKVKLHILHLCMQRAN